VHGTFDISDKSIFLSVIGSRMLGFERRQHSRLFLATAGLFVVIAILLRKTCNKART